MSGVFGVPGSVEGFVLLDLVLVKEKGFGEGFGGGGGGIETMPVVAFVIHLPVVREGED